MITYFENTDYYELKRNYKYILSEFYYFFHECYSNDYIRLVDFWYSFYNHSTDTQIFLITDYIKDHEEYFNIFIKIIDIIDNLKDENSLEKSICNLAIYCNEDDRISIFANVLLSLIRCNEFSLNLIPECSILNYANDQINIIQRSING